MYRVRFNLGRGEYFKTWKVEQKSPTGKWEKVEYYNTQAFSILLKGCKLHNGKDTAEKIFNGSNKSVCAWIECISFQAAPSTGDVPRSPQIKYDPKVAPYWRDLDGNNIDNLEIASLVTQGNQVYILKP